MDMSWPIMARWPSRREWGRMGCVLVSFHLVLSVLVDCMGVHGYGCGHGLVR